MALVLIGFLAGGLFTPHAFADQLGSLTTLTDAVQAVSTFLQQLGGHVQGSLDAIQTNTDLIPAVKAKTDNLPADPASQSAIQAAISSISTAPVNAVELTYQVDPPESGLDTQTLLPLKNGTVYAGHISGAFGGAPGNEFSVICRAPNFNVPVLRAQVALTQTIDLNFTCSELLVQVVDNFDGADAGLVIAGLNIHYSEASSTFLSLP